MIPGVYKSRLLGKIKTGLNIYPWMIHRQSADLGMRLWKRRWWRRGVQRKTTSMTQRQGWLKSIRNSYLNTGVFPRNLIWIYSVLKKSIFAYLKFDICIPSKFSGIWRFFYCSLHLTSILFAPLPYVWLNHHFSWLGNNCLKWTWDGMEYDSLWLPVSDIVNIQKSYIWIPALLKSHKCIPEAQFFHI